MATLPTKQEEKLAARRQRRLNLWSSDPDRMRAVEARHREKSRAKPEFPAINAATTKAYYWKHREWRSFQIRLRSYGLTLDQYHAKQESQDFGCAICGKEQVGRANSRDLLYVDHDHKTTRIRGLLCHNCNAGIGHFFDDPAVLMQAIAYVVHWQGVSNGV